MPSEITAASAGPNWKIEAGLSGMFASLERCNTTVDGVLDSSVSVRPLGRLHLNQISARHVRRVTVALNFFPNSWRWREIGGGSSQKQHALSTTTLWWHSPTPGRRSVRACVASVLRSCAVRGPSRAGVRRGVRQHTAVARDGRHRHGTHRHVLDVTFTARTAAMREQYSA